MKLSLGEKMKKITYRKTNLLRIKKSYFKLIILKVPTCLLLTQQTKIILLYYYIMTKMFYDSYTFKRKFNDRMCTCLLYV